jgi:hypothetical protein
MFFEAYFTVYKFNCHGFNRSRETERWRPGSIAKCWWMLKMPAAEAWACHLAENRQIYGFFTFF